MKRLIALLILLVGMVVYQPTSQQLQAAPRSEVCFVIDMPVSAIAPAAFAQDIDVGGVEPGTNNETVPDVSTNDDSIITSVFLFIYDFIIGKYPKIAGILSTVFAILWLISESLASSKLAENSIFQLIRRILGVAKNKSPTK